MPREYRPLKLIPTDLPPTFLAWAAGFIDGEGCIRGVPTPNENRGPLAAPTKMRLRMTVAQKPREALDLLRDRFGVGTVRILDRSGCHQWTVNSRQAEQVIRAVLPYLVVKRADALRALKAMGYD